MTVSTHIHMALPAVVEAIGHTGLYDYVEFVAEFDVILGAAPGDPPR